MAEAEGLEDYNRISVVKFTRMNMPSNITLPEKEGVFSNEEDDLLAVILESVDPYLTHLSSLEGKTVPVAEVIPKFADKRYCFYRIPRTPYDLSICNIDEITRNYCKRNRLVIPKLGYWKDSRKALFSVVRVDDKGHILVGPFNVGAMAYKGE